MFDGVAAVGDGYRVNSGNAGRGLKGNRKAATRIGRSGSYRGIIILDGNGAAGFKPNAAGSKHRAHIARGGAELSPRGYGKLGASLVFQNILYIYIVGTSFCYWYLKSDLEAAIFVLLDMDDTIMMETPLQPAKTKLQKTSLHATP